MVGLNLKRHWEIVMNIPSDIRTMTPVASHPAICKDGGSVNFPITLGFRASIIMNAITGPATTPFSTAERKSALIGFKCTKFSKSQIKVAAPIVA